MFLIYTERENFNSSCKQLIHSYYLGLIDVEVFRFGINNIHWLVFDDGTMYFISSNFDGLLDSFNVQRCFNRNNFVWVIELGLFGVFLLHV